MSRRPLIAGNWKMNGLMTEGLFLAEELAARLMRMECRADIAIFPPATLLALMAQKTEGSGLLLGGQNCHAAKSGAYTGDLSAPMLADCGASFVLLGHSERRAAYFETDAEIRLRALSAQEAGLVPVLCVGETEKEREEGLTFAKIESQIDILFKGGNLLPSTIVAYEPVWAIGSGRIPALSEISAVHLAIRRKVAQISGEDAAENLRILYGGSMKPENAQEILALLDVDGGLIGGASLKVEDFCAILQTCP